MTRRGSLAYYSVAVVCGSFFVALAYYLHSAAEWGIGDRWAYDLIFAYFLTIVAGIVPLLLYAATLRHLVRSLRWQAAWQWTLLGTVVGVTLLWILARLGYIAESAYFSPQRQGLKFLLVYPFVGPMMFTAKPFWLPIPVFAAASYVLYRVHRAFEPDPDLSQ